ncbi:MAG: RiPP maturation radical SAM C-methyltransferase [Candidatus Rokuibacteriota bacterium]
MRSEPHVLLVSMPFHALDAPSIQLGTLKAILDRSRIRAETRHYQIDFLERCVAATAEAPREERIGPGEYNRIDEHFWGGLGDWIFAAEPHRAADAERDRAYLDYLRERGVPERDLTIAVRMRGIAPDFLEACAVEALAARPAVVGFTTTLSHTLPALGLARILKERDPGLAIVFGGAGCDGPMGAALHRAFPFVDVVVRGEAERVLPGLVEELLAGRPLSARPGLCYRAADGQSIAVEQSGALVRMDEVPLPDYGEYFERIERASFYREVVTELEVPYEAARGCWWGERSHCTFCGLNGTAMAFRSKSAERVVEEIAALATRHEVLDVKVVDNIMDPRYLHDVLPRLADLNYDLRIFYEIKANLKRDHVRLLRNAGIVQIQPGIESLSTPILKLMRKGVSALQNLRLLKWCEEYGVHPLWNLVCGFPAEPPEEYARMADLCRSLVHLEPPRLGRLDLQRFSPYHARPEEFGIRILGPAPQYSFLYPELDAATRAEIAYSFAFAYGDGRDPEAYIAPVREAVRQWSEAREAGRSKGSLCYRRGPGFLRVVDQRPGLPGAHWTFGESEARVFLACQDGATPEEALAALEPEEARDLGVEWVEEWLEELVSERLAYEEGGRYLTLALPV